jgi:predicted NACHT family NTPase
LSNILGIVLDAGLHKSLRQLQADFPNPHPSQERFQIWWQINHAAWAEQLRRAIDYYRQIHQRWQFSPAQQATLGHYYTANQLLLDCLHSDCMVPAEIRQEIEATLLLPQTELEAREWQ